MFFTDVRVPKDQIVGQPGEGWKVANVLLLFEREDLGDPNATLTRLNGLIDLMKQETVDGQPIMANPVYRDRLMRIQGRVMAMTHNDLRLLSARLNKKDAMLAALIVKLQGCELRHQLEGLAIDTLGELGVLYDDSPYLRNEGSWQWMYMFYLGLIIGGGTAQIHQQLVFRPVPGLGRAETPIPALYLASSSAHPGGSVHGACGANAARAAMAGRRRHTVRRLVAPGFSRRTSQR